jgi:hypothetical protein
MFIKVTFVTAISPFSLNTPKNVPVNDLPFTSVASNEVAPLPSSIN